VLGEGADRYVVDASLGDHPQTLKRDPTGGLEQRRVSSGAVQCHRFAHHGQLEIIEHDDVGTRLERLLQLIDVLDLDLNAQTRRARARGAHRGPDRAGRRDVIFLDQHQVVESHAVIAAATASHRVLLCATQPRQGLAGVEDPTAGSRHRAHVMLSRGGRGREQLQEVERRALPGEQRTRRAAQLTQDIAGCDRGALGMLPADPHAGIELQEGLLEPGRAAQDRVLAAQHRGARLLSGGDQRCGDIARADILAQRARYLIGDVRRQLDRHSR